MMFLGLAFTVVALILLLYARYVEPNALVTRKLNLKSGVDITGEKPLKITLISDFHYPRFTTFRMVRRAVERSNAFDPDIVLFLGDFFDKNRGDPAVLPSNVRDLLGGIRSRLGVYGVLGNHDHWFDEQAIRRVIAAETEIRLIDNQAVRLDLPGEPHTSLYLVGVGDLWAGDVLYGEAVRGIPADAAIILLSHNPDVVEDIHDPRILVQFSGHTHGGQVRLPVVGALRVPSRFGNRYAMGLILDAPHRLYVNSGVCSMKNLRFLCPPEVTWVVLQ